MKYRIAKDYKTHHHHFKEGSIYDGREQAEEYCKRNKCLIVTFGAMFGCSERDVLLTIPDCPHVLCSVPKTHVESERIYKLRQL
jgi:hypothetical protein